ncbi:MAG: HIT family protein [Candidatus Hodarchaeales archaeon]|jgi:histidine triad (HIT) family protein
MSDDCIFCKIIAREIPAAIFYENENVIAFLDAFPAVKGHCLVVPKRHTESLRTSPAEVLQAAEVLPQLARIAAACVEAEGVNILCNDSSVAGQVIPHIHFHIVPRQADDGLRFHAPQQQADMEKLQALAKKFMQALKE